MKYYEIQFPNLSTLYFTSKETIFIILDSLGDIGGLTGPSGAIHNPKSFLTLREVLEPDERQKRVARDFAESIV